MDRQGPVTTERGRRGNGRARRTTHVLPILLLLLLSPLHLLDVLPRVATHIAGDVMDAAEYPQNEWWTAHALLTLRTNPFRNDHMFYPRGMHMAQHTYNFLDGLLYTLVRPWVPLLTFHNAVTWLAVFLNSLAAYCLIFRVTGLAGLAAIGAVAFAHSPVLTSYYGPLSLLEPYLLVFFVLTSHGLVTSPSLGRAIGSGVLLGLSVYTYPYYFVAGLVWLGVGLGYRLFPWTVTAPADGPQGSASRSWAVVPWVLLALTLAVVLLPRPARDARDLDDAVRHLYVLGVAATLGLLVWTGAKALARARRGAEGELVRWRPPAAAAAVTAVSLAAVLLATAALVALPYTHAYLTGQAGRATTGAPAIEFALYSVDVTGFFAPVHPSLSNVYGRIAADWSRDRPIVATPAFLGWLWIGLLVQGFALFLRRPALRLWLGGWTVFLLLCLGPHLKIHGHVYSSVVLPGYVIPHVPILAGARTLSRFLVPLMLLTVVIGALVLKPLCQGRSPAGRRLIYAGLALITTFEFALWPHPYQARPTDYRVPAVYHALAAKAGGRTGVLLDLPLFSHSGSRSEGRGQTRWHYYQTVHQQKLIGGVSSKLDDRVLARFEKLPSVPDLWARRPVNPDELERLLTTLGIDWIVVNKAEYPPDVLAAYLRALHGIPAVSPFYEDSAYLALAVSRASARDGPDARPGGTLGSRAPSGPPGDAAAAA